MSMTGCFNWLTDLQQLLGRQPESITEFLKAAYTR